MNQAVILARLFFPDKSLHILPDMLVRKKATKAQAQLDIHERRKNVKNAFSIKDPEFIRNKRICLIDDVYTTGSTVAECSRILEAAGAGEIRVFTFARVVLSP